MGVKDDLENEVRLIFKTAWTQRDGVVVPSDDNITLGNDAVNLDATVLYADLSDSTVLVDNYKPSFSAEIYKTFLKCCAKIIRSEAGAITAYDGDRVMAVFIGTSKNTSAVRAALKINWVVKNIIQAALRNQYQDSTYVVKHVVGIDTSKLFIARIGIRGSNDLVWVGRAANYAAKLCAIDSDFSTWITESIYRSIEDEAKYSNSKDMWEARTWTAINNMRIYGSTYWWSIS